MKEVTIMKRFLCSLLTMGLLALTSNASLTQTQADVQVSITAPTDGFVTLSPTLTVQGTVQAPEGSQLDLVLVSVNGKAQKADLKADGSFEAEVELEYFGENFVSATAITDTKQFDSARISVNLQRRVLFFDDFEADRVRPEWGMVSGNWILEVQAPANRIFTVEAKEGFTDTWRKEEHTTKWAFVNIGLAWQDYAVEVDVLGNRGWFAYGYVNGRWGPHRKPQGLYVAVRVRDAQNLVAFEVMSDALGEGRGDPYEGWMCWRVMRNGSWSDCFSIVKPSAPLNFRIRIEVKGNLFTAYINGAPVSSWRDIEQVFSQGTTGLGIWHKFQGAEGAFDNFKVESLEERPTSAIAAKEAPPPPDWELIKDQLAQHERQLQGLDNRLNTLQSDVGRIKMDLPQLQERVTPSDLEALSHEVDNLKDLLQRRGQDKRVETLQALLGEQMVKVKHLEEDMEQMTREFEEVRKKAESAEAKAEAVDGKATLGLILGAAGAALALLTLLGVLH